MSSVHSSFVFLFLFLLAGFPTPSVGSTPSHDGSKSRSGKASLHELLLRNRDIASVIPEKSPRQALFESEANSFEENENRRILVLGDGEDTPNYVYDEDENLTTVEIDDEQKQPFTHFYDPSLHHQHHTTEDVEDDMTQGHPNHFEEVELGHPSHFEEVELPSYADPNLLAAVMNQADEANFRYPIEKEGTVLDTEDTEDTEDTDDQSTGESAKIQTYSKYDVNDINPYDLFPPSFHDLIEIPIHVYPNGSSYNPHDRYRSRPRNPTITGGYANMNLNGPYVSKEEKISIKAVKPLPEPTIKPREPLEDNKFPFSNFESKRIDRLDTSTIHTTTPRPISTSYASDIISTENPSEFSSHRRTHYTSIDRNENRNFLANHPRPSPPPSYLSNHERRTNPSLRFRTRAPFGITKSEPSTITTTTTTTTTPLPQTPPSFITTTQSHVFSPPSVYGDFNEQFIPSRRIPFVNKDAIIPKAPELSLSQIENQRTHPKRKFSQFHDYDLAYDKKREFSRISNPNFQPSIYYNKNRSATTQFHKVSPAPEKLNVYEVFPGKNRQAVETREKFLSAETLNRHDSDDQKKSESFSFSGPNTFGNKIPTVVYKNSLESDASPSNNDQTENFKPSRRDSYHGNQPLRPFRGYKNEQLILPTTYRPYYSKDEILALTTTTATTSTTTTTTRKPTEKAYLDVLSPIRNVYSEPHEETEEFYVYDSQNERDVPFTNSHILRNQFRESSDYNKEPEEHDYYQEDIPIYVSSPVHENHDILHRQFENYHHPSLNEQLYPPPVRGYETSDSTDRFSQDYAPSRPISYQASNNRPTTLRRRPSFLEKLGFFRPKQVSRRSGVSGPKAKVNNIENYDIKKNLKNVDYVLTNGPAPVNGKKVVVIGPFKEPPIGAPVIYPGNEGTEFITAPTPTNPSYDLKPPSSQPIVYNKEETPEREPSFKVIQVPKQHNKAEAPDNLMQNSDDSQVIVVQSRFEVGDTKRNADGNSYRQGSVMSVNRFTDSLSGRSQTATKDTYTTDKQAAPSVVRAPLVVNHKNYHLFEEVTDEDKERLIAAKFHIPRLSSVRRSGVIRNYIPLPVPEMTSSGQQVLKFKNVEMPHNFLTRKMGLLPLPPPTDREVEKVFIPSSDVVQILSPTNDREVKKVFIPSLNVVQNPYVKSDNTPKTEKLISPQTTTTAKPSDNVVLQTTTQKFPEASRPESYHEPFVSEITFGGWHAVGDSPVLSYVKENTPLVQMKTTKKASEEAKR